MKSKSSQVGESVVMECTISGSPKPTITWFKDNKILLKSARLVTAMDDQFLVVVHVDESDEGTYMCEGTNTQGTIRQRADLTVSSGMSIILSHVLRKSFQRSTKIISK